MLKRIDNIFERKKLLFKKSQDKKEQLRDNLKIFLKSKFGDNLIGLSLVLDYNPKDNSLTINTDSKILANELSLLLVDLGDYFKIKNLKLDKILIK